MSNCLEVAENNASRNSLAIFIHAVYLLASLALKDPRKNDVHFRCPSLLYGPATCKYPEKTIGVHGASGYSRPANPDVPRKVTGSDAPRPPRYRYDALLCTYACERATDANGERIHSSHRDRRSQEKSQITGCGRFTGTIEMWVMQPKEQKFVYTRKERVR